MEVGVWEEPVWGVKITEAHLSCAEGVRQAEFWGSGAGGKRQESLLSRWKLRQWPGRGHRGVWVASEGEEVLALRSPNT